MITFEFVDGYISPVLSTGDNFRDEHNECRLEYCPLTGAQVFLKTLKNNKQDERGEQAKSMVEEEGIYFY